MTTYTLTVPNKNGSYDGDYVVKQYTSLTISSGNTLTTDQPCKGLFIYVQGDCTINGTLTMQARGAASNPDSALASTGIKYPVLVNGAGASISAADFTGCGSAIISAVANQYSTGNGKVIQIGKRGSNGGAAVTGSINGSGSGSNGSAGSYSGTDTISLTLGGGGAGGWYSDTNSCNSNTTIVSGRGGNSTAFSGGTGGGGKMSGSGVSYSTATQGDDNGGEGGEGGNGHCGGVHDVTGGVGNPGGWTQYGSVNQSGFTNQYYRVASGTGGVIWLVVGGNLTIGAGGSINVAGTTNVTTNVGNTYGAGGGSGGGAAILLYRGTFTNNGSIVVGGGQGGTGYNGGGGSGGNGVSYSLQIM